MSLSFRLHQNITLWWSFYSLANDHTNTEKKHMAVDKNWRLDFLCMRVDRANNNQMARYSLHDDKCSRKRTLLVQIIDEVVESVDRFVFNIRQFVLWKHNISQTIITWWQHTALVCYKTTRVEASTSGRNTSVPAGKVLTSHRLIIKCIQKNESGFHDFPRPFHVHFPGLSGLSYTCAH